MQKAAFFLSILLSLALAASVAGETWIYKKWDDAAAGQQDAQSRLALAQRMSVFNEQFLHRLALESLHDPAIADMLKKHKLKVTVTAPIPPSDTVQGATLPAAQSNQNPTDKLTAVPEDQASPAPLPAPTSSTPVTKP